MMCMVIAINIFKSKLCIQYHYFCLCYG